jgi:phosphoglycerate dehydrogenase-like enzyme
MYDKFKNDADLININDLDNHFPNVDILIGCLPENDETRQLLDNYRINLLKKSSIIVNVGRGSLIDENTLINNIKSEKLAGAFLDVTDKEPISDDSPLWSIPNIILSQHSGGGYESEVNDKILFFKENLSRYKNKILPKNIVL